MLKRSVMLGVLALWCGNAVAEMDNETKAALLVGMFTADCTGAINKTDFADKSQPLCECMTTGLVDELKVTPADEIMDTGLENVYPRLLTGCLSVISTAESKALYRNEDDAVYEYVDNERNVFRFSYHGKHDGLHQLRMMSPATKNYVALYNCTAPCTTARVTVLNKGESVHMDMGVVGGTAVSMAFTDAENGHLQSAANYYDVADNGAIKTNKP